jgi:hypothetical protein
MLADMLGMLHSTELTFSAQKPENQASASGTGVPHAKTCGALKGNWQIVQKVR